MIEKELLFISDVHLSVNYPDRIQMFCEQLLKHGRYKDIYILGDLFDAWVGDDCIGSWLNPIERAISEIIDTGSKIFIMHGNHDFLMGPKIFALLKAQHISDPYILNERFLLTHGDNFCLNDTAYHILKPILQHSITKKIFLMFSLTTREKIAKNLIGVGRPKMTNEKLIRSLLDQKISTIIHGHMHKESVRFEENGKVICLGSWEDKPSFFLQSKEIF